MVFKIFGSWCLQFFYMVFGVYGFDVNHFYGLWFLVFMILSVCGSWCLMLPDLNAHVCYLFRVLERLWLQLYTFVLNFVTRPTFTV